MIKYLLIFILGLLICQDALAQKADTSFFYKNNSGNVVSTKDSADYLMMIIKPDDYKEHSYTINEYYLSGKRKLSEKALLDPKRPNDVILEGPCIEFYPTGHTKSITNYTSGYVNGDVFLYYPNGKIFANEKVAHRVILLVSCRDSTGKVLAENGKGQWVQYNDHFDKIIEQGAINDSLKDGEWQGYLGDTGRYVINYKKGVPGPGIGYDAANKAYPFTYIDIMPVYNVSGKKSLFDFVKENMHYPDADKENNVHGRVLVQFIIEKDGRPSHIKAIRAPDETLANEAIRVVALTLWKPGIYYGMPKQTLFTLPIVF